MNHPQPHPCAMSTGDTWHGGVALTSLSNKKSTGSYDSVISMNSGYSEDSMEHLSAEERACLMYLEQTIEAWEMQEDSGLSNDEPDSVLLLEKMGLTEVDDISRLNFESRMDQRSETLPTLLGGLPAEEASECMTFTEENIPEHYLLNQNCEPNFTTVSSTEDLRTYVNVISRPQLLVTGSVTGCDIPLDTDTEGLCLPPIDDSPNVITCITPEIDVGLIPPPSDFMDDPGPDAQPSPELAPEPDPEADCVEAPPHSSSSRPVSIDLKRLYQRALEKRPPVSPPANHKHLTDKLPIEARQSLPALESLVPVIVHPEVTEPKSPPFVAPRPKRLSVKTPHQTQTTEPNSPIAPNGNQQLLDHKRIHLQALQKLGLLKGSVADLDPSLSQELSPQTRKSWADLPYRSSQSLLNLSNLTPSDSFKSNASPGSPSTASSGPSAFSDRARLLLSDRGQSPVNNVLAVNTQMKFPPLTPSDLVKQLTKATGAQSGSTEHSGQRLSRPVDRHKSISVQQCLSHAISPDVRRRGSSHQHSQNSHKESRSQGVSVLICPRDENGVGRREALKKLGLIRD
ncbi:specifically androgen-regulated gene protein-like isoform X1 [Phycodurus eques]|uniref:specifically androgen-regulated gene protein-like isoform X1 n=2 Tax=Phycodurus eques TaxID=693459 RepID=UPI002ACDC93D|nr:specifically androgen-regulated gene protein-like isoform X1 [Phycodurus eques]